MPKQVFIGRQATLILLPLLFFLSLACQPKELPGGTIAIAPVALTDAAPTSLRLQFAPPTGTYRTHALPAAWDQARFAISSATALARSVQWIVPYGSFAHFPAAAPPYEEFVGTQGSSPTFLPLKPASDYNLSAYLESDHPEGFKTLEAYANLSNQAIASGPNSKTFSMTLTGNVSGLVGVGAATTDDLTPDVAAGASRFLTVFARAGVIVAHGFDANGTSIAAMVVSNTSGAAARPRVSYNPVANRFMVVWDDNQAGFRGIYGRAVALSATAISAPAAEFWLAGGSGVVCLAPDVAASTLADRYLVVWHDDRNVDNDVFAKRIDTAGTQFNNFAGTTVSVIGNSGGNDANAAAEFSSVSNQYFVAFERGVDPNTDLYYQRVNAPDARPLDGSGAVLESAASRQFQVTLAYNSDSDYMLAAWRDDRSGVANIYYKIFNVGANSFPVAATRLSTASVTAAQPAAAYSSGVKSYVVVFDDYRVAGQRDNAYRRIKLDGVTLWGDKPIMTDAPQQMYPEVAYVNGNFFAVWQDDRNSATQGYNVYGRVFR